MTTIRRLVFGKDAKKTHFGRRSCSHGMYTGGFNYYVYGIAGLFAYEVKESWGDFRTDKF